MTIMAPAQALTAMQAGAAIEQLPRLVAMIADLVHIHGLQPADVAHRLSLPLSTITEHLITVRNARQALATALTNRASAFAPRPPVVITPPPAPVPPAREMVKLAFKPSALQIKIIDMAMQGIRPAEITRCVGTHPAYVSCVLRIARHNGVPVVRFAGGNKAKSKPPVTDEPDLINPSIGAWVARNAA